LARIEALAFDCTTLSLVVVSDSTSFVAGIHLPIIVPLLAGVADTVAGSDAAFSEGRSVGRAGVLDYSEKQEEKDYVDDKCYDEIVGQKI
jgi:hypothetical protein